jgi:hypothetical protein
MFVFDYFTERALFIELTEVIPGKKLQKAICTLSVGDPPRPEMQIEELKSDSASLDLGESFYGDESFEMDELDKEGFEGLDDIPLEPDDPNLY